MADPNNGNILVGEEKALSYLTGPVVQVIVNTGADSKTFHVHRDLLSFRSHFFAKAVQTYGEDGDFRWREGEDGIIKLPEDEPEVFAGYVQLIYQNILPFSRSLEGDTEEMSAEELSKAVNCAVDHEHDLLGKLYVFCDKVQDRKGKKLIIIAFIEGCSRTREDERRHFPTGAVVKLIYEGTIEGDPLRKFLVDCHVLLAHERWVVKSKAEEYNHEFLFDVMVAMTIRRKAPADRAVIKCAEGYWKLLDIDGEEDK